MQPLITIFPIYYLYLSSFHTHKLLGNNLNINTGLFKKKCTLSKIYFAKTADAKSMSCVRMERKSLKVLIPMIWSGASLRLWLLLHVTCVGRAGLSTWHLPRQTWDSHRVLVRCTNNFESFPFSLYIACRHMFNSTCKIIFWKYVLLFE
jgi:hypothetical protein